MTRKELSARATNIQRAVASTTTCTSATVESLRSFLAPTTSNTVPQQGKPISRAQPPKVKGSAARPAKGAGAQTAKRPTVTVLGLSSEETNSTQSHDKQILATEVVNATLKSLTDAVKDSPARKVTQAKTKALKRSSSSSSFSNAFESRSQTPLQPLCVNRLANSPGQKNRSERSSSMSSRKQTMDGLRAQAECARIAFASLRSLQGQKDSPSTLPCLQLESGMSALIGKSLALGFDDVALRELRILKRRLEGSKTTLASQDRAASTSPWDDEEKLDPRTETLAGLLRFRNIEARGQLLSLFITTQLQVLNILALKRDACAIEAALQHLQFSTAHSPANLIQDQLELAVPGSEEKVARQLESLTKALLALCPIVSVEDDKSAAPGRVSPETIFQIQVLAFEVRSTWWQILGHQGNVDKDVVGPFTQCLMLYNNSSKSTKEKKYEVAKIALETTKVHIQKVKGFREDVLFLAYQLLADLAQGSSQYPIAIRWIRKAKECTSKSTLSRARLCNLSCRLASLELQLPVTDSTDKLITLLGDAAQCLAGDLQGEAAELDELLIAVASLRRSAFSLFQSSHRSSKAEELILQSALPHECSNIVLLCARFLIRYVGSGSSRDGHEKTALRLEQRKNLAARSAISTIESIVAMARLCAGSEAKTWNFLEKGLQDCVRLALSIATSSANGALAESEETRASSFLSISSAYWYRYQYLKRAQKDVKLCRECLLVSIGLLRDRPLYEKHAGALPLKLEKLGQLCEDIRDYEKAAESYEEALHVELDSDALRTAMGTAAVRSVPSQSELSSELLSLSRKLSAYMRAASKAIDLGSRRQTFFDAEWLSTSQRGDLLERQLISLLSNHSVHGPASTNYNTLNVVGISLLSIYEHTSFPVRRLRVTVRLLLSLLTSPGALRNELVNQLLEEPKDIATNPHSDIELGSFLPHLLSCRRLLIALREKTPNAKELESVINSWSNMVKENLDKGSLQTHVYDIADWLVQLELLGEYLDMQGLELYRVSALNIAVLVHEAMSSSQRSMLVSKLSELGLQHVRLGYSGLAGSVLHKAQRYLDGSDLNGNTKLKWNLAYAEYSLAGGDTKTSKESLARAHELFEGGACMEKPEKMRSKNWSDLALTVADAYYVQSLLAATEGQLSKAILFARLCVKNCHRSWAILERSQNKIDKAARKDTAGSENDPLVDGMSDLSISASTEVTSTHHLVLTSVAFWTLVPRIVRGLNHLSLLFSYHGLYPEVRYYLEQSQTIAKAIEAASLNSQTTALLGSYRIRSGGVDEGVLLLHQAQNLVSRLPRDRHYASLQLFLASHHTKRGELGAREAAIGLAESTYQNLVAKSFVDDLIQRRSAATLEIAMSSLTIQEAKPVPHVRQRQTTSKRTQSKSSARTSSPKPSPEEAPAVEVYALNQMKGEITRGRVHAMIFDGGLDAAASLLNDAVAHTRDQQDLVINVLLASRLRFRQGLDNFVSDPVFCVIPESIISCPAIKYCSSGKQEKPTKSSSPPKGRSAACPKRGTGKVLAQKVKPRSPSPVKDQSNFLRLVQDEISKVFKQAMASSSTAIVHEISDVLGKVLVVLSAVTASNVGAPISSGVLSYFLEVGRMISMTRESSAIRIERWLPNGRDAFDWPSDDAIKGQENAYVHDQLEISTFQADYIDIIPRDWNVVSLTLSQELDEILVSKIRSGQAPFVLRLPLNRHNPADQDEETFGYHQGRVELQNLINLANSSAHDARDLSHKGAKTEWWEKRATLDARLKDLLINIETIWLGGFKSIFSQTTPYPALLSRFQQSLQNILDKHLPSRQKSGRGGQPSRVALDARVLELFVGLAKPSDSNDLDEPLMDLLYFVVDILQFNGERNAYDEIDFDSIVVDVIDALRQYHQAVENEQGNESEKHTILILDKHLHCFPWESLPCIRDHAVSRLPSLGCLRDRILQQRRNPESIDDRIYARKNMGASILNPGDDLKATQAKFEEPLREFPGWECIIQREPTEAEMRTCLESNDIFLYFGHGSGGQYIRSRTIKKLDRCAVALLMGCSSGALTEAGEFEPYGTPMSYMHAGSPAILATLWDVTDKDIDRFSHTVLEKWGLFESQQPPVLGSPVKKGVKQKGKGRAKKTEKVEEVESRPISLDQAVAQSRDSCILRYLNGAAPVVYGVPVYLS